MCDRTVNSCQNDDPHARCGGRLKRNGEGPSRGRSACLPAWKFDNQVKKQLGQGSAVDAD